MPNESDHELLISAARKVDELHQDWFGPGQREGLRDVVLKTRDRSLKNTEDISRAKWLIRGIIGVLSASGIGGGIVAMLGRLAG